MKLENAIKIQANFDEGAISKARIAQFEHGVYIQGRVKFPTQQS